MSELVVISIDKLQTLISKELKSVLKEIGYSNREVKQTYKTHEALEYLGMSSSQFILKKAMYGIKGVRYGREKEYAKEELDELKRRMRDDILG